MTTVEVPARKVVVPRLPAEAAALLPRRWPFAARLLAGLVVGIVVLVLSLLSFVATTGDHGPRDEAVRLLYNVAPWILTAPWLRHLDMRRVLWFFLCLAFGPFSGVVLVSIVTYRALTAPVRDWPVAYWNVHRARVLAGQRTWVLLSPEDAGPDPRSQREIVLTTVERGAWAVLIATAVPVFAWSEQNPGWILITWSIGLVVTALAPRVVELGQRTAARFAG